MRRWNAEKILKKYGYFLTGIVLFCLGFFMNSEMMKTFISKVKHFEVENTVSTGASLLTFLIFFMYLLGKIYYIKEINMTLQDSFKIENDEGEGHNLNVREVIEVGEILNEVIYFTPDIPIREILIYENVSKDNNVLIKRIGPMSKGETIKIISSFDFFRYKYSLTYERFDFMKGEIVLGSGLKKDIVHIHDSPNLEHTIKSYIYYLVK